MTAGRTVRAYRLLMLVLPRGFRARHGPDMEELFLEALVGADSRFGAARLWAAAIVDVLRRAPVEHWRGRTPISSRLRGVSMIGNDLRFALRTFRRQPAITGMVVGMLALGIGANTAIFSIVKAVLLEPLPYTDGDRLVTMSPYPWTPAEIILDVEDAGNSFEHVAGYYPQSYAITGGEQPYQLEGAQVTPNFFQLLQAEMALGRNFVAADAEADAAPTVIISFAVWQRRYGGSRDVIGQRIQAVGEIYEIIGVLDRGFRQLTPESQNPGLWLPFEIERTNAEGLNEGMNYVIPLARLKPGVALQRAQSELDAVVSRFEARNPGFQRTFRWATVKSQLIENVRTVLLVLQLAVGVVLLIACVNVANLLLARYNSRQTEVAIRSALGASSGRLLRQLMTESLVLSVVGGLAGLLLMLLSLELILVLAPSDVPRIGEASIDASVFLFTLGISVVTGLLFGALPAVATTRRPPDEVLKEGGRTPSGSRKQRRIGQALAVTEIALALVLLVGAGLLARGFMLLTDQELGFRTENVLTISLEVPENRYQSVPALTAFYRGVLERLQQMPELESAALSKNPPIGRGGSTRPYLVEGEADIETARDAADYDVISPDYFRTLGIPLLRGRYFEGTDRRRTSPVAIIDEALWRKAWPGQDPIGKRFRFEEDGWLTVVGVVRNTRGSGLASDPHPGFYIPYQQRPETPTALAVARAHTVLLVRSRTGLEDLAGSLRRAIWDVDPHQPVPEITTLDRIISQGVAPERFRAVLLGCFAAIALILVIAGIYAVTSYTVSQQTHEFGIRMAMGATSRDVVRGVLKWGLRLIVLGVAFGLIGTFMVARYLESFLFGVAPSDPVTIVASVVAIVLVTLISTLIPAYKATQVDPMIALRSAGVVRSIRAAFPARAVHALPSKASDELGASRPPSE